MIHHTALAGQEGRSKKKERKKKDQDKPKQKTWPGEKFHFNLMP